jgi:hypothetical protein
MSTYWLGVLGSISVEIGAAAKSCADLNGACPDRYKKPFYLLIRGMLALVGGSLPVVPDATNALASFYLGASAPLVLDRLGRGIHPSENSDTTSN